MDTSSPENDMYIPLEEITRGYWVVSYEVRHPDSGGKLNAHDAFQLLNTSQCLRQEAWRLQELMHIIRFDIIEGNSALQQKENSHSDPKTGCILIHPRRNLTSTGAKRTHRS